MENLNLIRKIAWDFTRKSNLEYQELFSEAALAYCEAISRFDPKNEAKWTTFAYCCITNHLLDYCMEETVIESRTYWTDEWPDHMHPTTEQDPISIYEIIETWPDDAQEVVEMVLDDVHKYMASTPNFRRRYVGQKRRLTRVEKDLQKEGWCEDRIQNTIQTIQQKLQLI